MLARSTMISFESLGLIWDSQMDKLELYINI
jgi:hypothetical protein